MDSLKTWKDDVFTVVNYNEFEKPYLFQLFDVNAVGYANALLDYNEQGLSLIPSPSPRDGLLYSMPSSA